MSVKKYDVSSDIIIEDGFQVSKLDKVYEVELKSSLKIKDSTNWPVLYIMYSEDKKKIYIGESINVVNRMKTHLSNKDIKDIDELKYFLIVYYRKSNLSVIWNLEDSMIRCAFAYERISKNKEILNNAVGHAHKFFNMSKYNSDVKASEIWDILKEKGIVDKPFSEIEKDYMYKLSPFIELKDNQEEIKIKTLKLLKSNDSILINGMPGTGKTILALNMARTITEVYKDKTVAIVTPVTTFATTLKKVVKNVKVFNEVKIFTPVELANYYYKTKKRIDYIIVDESHRLRYCKNSGQLCQANRNIVFWKIKNELIEYFNTDDEKEIKRKVLIEGFDCLPEEKIIKRKKKDKSEVEVHIKSIDKDIIGKYLKKDDNKVIFESISQLDWIEVIGEKKIYFYDEMQAIRLEDLNKKDLENRLSKKKTKSLELSESIRIKNRYYIKFIERLLELNYEDSKKHIKDFLRTSKKEKYEFNIFDTFSEMEDKLKEKQKEKASCRLLSGYYKEWVSKKEKKYDFIFDGKRKKKWNSTIEDWCSTEKAIKLEEIGCVYTIQGYDIDYAGVIIGEELDYDGKMKVNIENYKDAGGKEGLKSKEMEGVLLEYIKRIYRILLTRGIKGTYIYICNPNLKEYIRSTIEDILYSVGEDGERYKELKVSEESEEYKCE